MDNTSQIDEFQQLLAQRIGLRIQSNDHDRFVRTLHERASRMGYPTLAEYRTFLADNKASGEWEEFVRVFTSVETFFFRDNGQLDLLRLRLLPELIARHRNDKTLRLWSAGCSSGEEAYSLAILIDMLLPERDGWNVFILGTDIDSKAIAKAQLGRYGQWSFRLFPAILQQRYFQQDGNEWVLNERIRSMVTFRVGNLVAESFPDYGTCLHDMDMILCRNVFLYFDSAAVSAVAAKLSAMLVEDGYLLTGHTELIGHPVPGLESRLFAEGVVYQRQQHAQLTARVVQPHLAVGAAIRASAPLAIPEQRQPYKEVHDKKIVEPVQTLLPVIALSTSARTLADHGEYLQAEQMCREALIAEPLQAAPYFLLAQLAQIKGDFNQAKDFLNKTLYLDQRCVAAYLELATLYEREGELAHAQSLRRTALGLVRAMPDDEQIEQYERTAGELAQWLEQWELLANNHASSGANT